MVIVMIVAMRSMYPSKRLNIVICGIAAPVFVANFAAMRTQAAVRNAEFLRSMIPHHSGAILMCREASISDPEIVRLCDRIIQSQRGDQRNGADPNAILILTTRLFSPLDAAETSVIYDLEGRNLANNPERFELFAAVGRRGAGQT